MAKVRWSEKSSKNLQALYEYISRDSKIYAGRFVESLIKAVKKLEIMPFYGRVVPEFERDELREVIYRNYRIVYRLVGDDNNVEVLAVIHSARDINSLFSTDFEL
ncbi:MAG: type II toxin-antitoxin system RelE/ParE family toxin [Acidobacteria bacterium]|jgi:plasmid stabilization system protein ParE|nr:type II toxin-antitoxin system RelE/ParE family toxin [Acidobacteriota bacterium]